MGAATTTVNLSGIAHVFHAYDISSSSSSSSSVAIRLFRSWRRRRPLYSFILFDRRKRNAGIGSSQEIRVKMQVSVTAAVASKSGSSFESPTVDTDSDDAVDAGSRPRRFALGCANHYGNDSLFASSEVIRSMNGRLLYPS